MPHADSLCGRLHQRPETGWCRCRVTAAARQPSSPSAIGRVSVFCNRLLKSSCSSVLSRGRWAAQAPSPVDGASCHVLHQHVVREQSSASSTPAGASSALEISLEAKSGAGMGLSALTLPPDSPPASAASRGGVPTDAPRGRQPLFPFARGDLQAALCQEGHRARQPHLPLLRQTGHGAGTRDPSQPPGTEAAGQEGGRCLRLQTRLPPCRACLEQQRGARRYLSRLVDL